MGKPEIGEIRYEVFVDWKTDRPFVSRMQLVAVSPKGRLFKYAPLDSTDRTPANYSAGRLPARTIADAIQSFQEDRAVLLGFGDRYRELRLICQAERLKVSLERVLSGADRQPPVAEPERSGNPA